MLVRALLVNALLGATLSVVAQSGGDKVRSHPRVTKEIPEGQREKLTIGALFLPKALAREGKVPLFIHFHGGDWLPEVAAAQHKNTAVITVQLGSGSAVYGKPFVEAKAFADLLAEAEKKAGAKFGPITLTAWSAGYGAVRAILRHPEHYARIEAVILLDGLHAGYVADKDAKGLAKINVEHLDIYLQLARDAAAGKKSFIVVHSQIVPGTYASTTETADYLLHHLKFQRQPAKKVGPMLTQQLSEVRMGKFLVLGFEGDTAADHIDHLHALPDYLKRWHAAK